MRMLIGLAYVIAVFAADANPMLQTWRLNSEKSTIHGAVPTFIHNGYIRPRPQTGPMPYDKNKPILMIYRARGERKIYQGTVSPDGRVLTLAEQGLSHSVLVLDLQ